MTKGDILLCIVGTTIINRLLKHHATDMTINPILPSIHLRDHNHIMVIPHTKVIIVGAPEPLDLNSAIPAAPQMNMGAQ
jgi:hypothetical protein